MARPRTRLPWRYDDARQEFITPAGVVTLHELAALRYGLATSRVSLTGPWTGWRLSGSTLRGPRGTSITLRPDTATQFSRWLRDMEARHAASLGLPVTVLRPRLALAYDAGATDAAASTGTRPTR